MKLASFRSHGETSFGIVEAETVRDLGKQFPELGDLRTLLLRSAGAVADFVSALPTTGSVAYGLAEVELLAPIPNPAKYLGIGVNYRAHLAQSTLRSQPRGQIWFNKQVSCVHGPFADVWMPAVSTQLDYEGELGVVIGKRCRGVKASAAWPHIAGFLICNDLSVRDWQFRAPTHTLGKSFDTHGPMGPWLVTMDEIGAEPDLEIRTLVNGAQRQSGRTSDMIYSVPEMIEELSTACTLEPGDVLTTGTPAGVGMSMTPPTYLRPGDVVRIEIERLGYIQNRVIMLGGSSAQT